MFHAKLILGALLIILLWHGQLLAQSRIVIDLKEKQSQEVTVESNEKALIFALENCEGITAVRLQIHRPQQKPLLEPVPVIPICDSIVIPIDLLLEPDQQGETRISVEIQTGNEKIFKAGITLLISAKEVPAVAGSVKPGASGQGTRTESGPKPLPNSGINFVPPSYLTAPVPTVRQKGACLVEYYPISNKYKVINGRGEEESFLRYRSFHLNATSSKKNKTSLQKRACRGVIFKVVDFNTLKYDIEVNSQFSNAYTNTETPPLLDLVLDRAAGAKELFSTEDLASQAIVRIIGDLKHLRKQLQDYFSWRTSGPDELDQSSLDSDKRIIAANITSRFPNDNGINILPTYHQARNALLETGDIDNGTFNNKFKKTYGLLLTPDELADQTQLLIQKLMHASLRYQYNIPQLQNKDLLELQITIESPEGLSGPIHVDNQPLKIPIRGGIKVDFSTGLYYSSISSKKFAFVEEYKDLTDTILTKTIIEEGSNSGGATGGVAALAHFYPRLNNVSAGLSFGVGMAPGINYSLLFGGSIVIGKKKRIALSGGVNYSSVKRLSSSLEVGQVLPPKAAIKTESHLRHGYFLAFTYNFGLNTSVQLPELTDIQQNTGDASADQNEEGKNEAKKEDKKNSGS